MVKKRGILLITIFPFLLLVISSGSLCAEYGNSVMNGLRTRISKRLFLPRETLCLMVIVKRIGMTYQM